MAPIPTYAFAATRCASIQIADTRNSVAHWLLISFSRVLVVCVCCVEDNLEVYVGYVLVTADIGLVHPFRCSMEPHTSLCELRLRTGNIKSSYSPLEDTGK